jgi:surface antigen
MSPKMWSKIADQVSGVREGVVRTVQQCKWKIDTLKRQYRKCTNGPQSGLGQCTWKWFNVMSEGGTTILGQVQR